MLHFSHSLIVMIHTYVGLFTLVGLFNYGIYGGARG